MTQRPLLEKTSWVAGIASAVIAAFLWLKPSPSEHSKADIKTELRVSSPVLKDISNKTSSETIATAAKPKVKTRWSCEGISNDLQPALTAAKNISYTSPRDTALLSLSRKALCLEKYEMFEQVAQQISYIAPRDQAYGDAVDFALGVRKFELAEKFAEKIAYSAPRDEARARIAEKSSER